MKIYEVPQYRSDLETELKNTELEFLRGKSILVTGSTGLICSAIVDMLLFSNKYFNTGIRIFAAGRGEEKLRQRFDFSGGDIRFVRYDALKPFVSDEHFDYIIHGASNASPELYVTQPVETMLSNIVGISNLLESAINNGTSRLLYISSSEVYGRKDYAGPFKEDEYGYVDILNVRSSYPSGKRASETLCRAYGSEYNIETVIVRPGHIYGPTASTNDKRISSDFAYKAARGENLVMKSAGTQLRSYCYCLDCASAILTVLGKGENGQAYNISNSASVITIRQMSQILADSANVDLIVESASAEEQAAFNPMNNSSLEAGRLEALGWAGSFDAQAGFSHTVTILREMIR